MSTDFIGFSFDGVHSSYLGLKRVSDDTFYNEILQPNFENKLNQVSGRDGQYYFGADYGEKEINMQIAFDSVTEKQFRQITNLFSTKKICSLILDERPYKMYNVRLSAPISLNYACFDEPIRELDNPREGLRVINREEVPIDPEDPESETTIQITRETVYPYKYKYDESGRKLTQRIYKGEGEINFICTSPMAKAPFKTLDDYTTPRLSYDVLTEAVNSNFITRYENVSEWSEASGILTKEQRLMYNIDRPVSIIEDEQHSNYNIEINVYNSGDIDVPFLLYLPYHISDVVGERNGLFKPKFGNVVRLYTNASETMEIANFTAKATLDAETGVIINSENHLIEGVYYNKATHRWTKTGNLYNNYIIAGDFSLILKQDIFQKVKNDTELGKQSVCINYDAEPEDVWIEYNYLYY